MPNVRKLTEKYELIEILKTTKIQELIQEQTKVQEFMQEQIKIQELIKVLPSVLIIYSFTILTKLDLIMLLRTY